MIDLTTYTEDELLDLQQALTDERNRRAALPAIEEARAETATKIAQQLAEENPELVEKPTETSGGEVRAWEEWHPLKGDTHFRYGDKVRHNGKVWRDTLDPTRNTLNVWEPGAPGIDGRYWVEEPEAGAEKEAEPGGEPEAEATESGKEPGNNQDNTNAVREWKPGQDVKPGERYTFQNATYEVLQAHTTAAHWPPDAVPALYKKI